MLISRQPAGKKKFWKIHTVSRIFFFVMLLFLFSCRNKIPESADVIAIAGDRAVTPEEFRLFYELDPNFGIDSTGYPALKTELQRYLDRILANRYSRTTGLQQDSLFLKAVKWERRRAMLRQLYRETVELQVTVSEGE
ncbi:MAG: hypothetical protein WAN36_04215, partial [Calditrichia bacterium]